jgi:hypothetical protein
MIRSLSCPARLLTAVLVLLSVSLSVSLVGCGESSAPSKPTGITIQGSTNATVDPSDSVSYTATVTNDTSNAGVSWTLSGTSCTGAACGTLNSVTTTGVTYTAPSTVTTPITVTITVTSVADASLTTTITLSIPANPSIITPAGALAGGTVGTPYSVTLTATGGITPYGWSVTQGTLPAGLTLGATTGIISGTPTAAGSSSFTVTLTDSGSPALTASAQYTIAMVYPPLAISLATLPPGSLGNSYNAMITANGGSGTGYTFTVLSGTGLSAVGLTLSSSGAITGTPNAAETSTPFTVQVTDSAGNTATATLTLTITSVVFQGQVLSGTTPVSGATIQLYTVGSGGNGKAATPMLTQTVTTDSIGMFNLAGFYTCGQGSNGDAITGGSNQVYLVATGGIASQTSTTSNPALVMVTAVGPCTNLATTPFFTINEITTAAAAWALSPFSTSATNIGATSTNTLGITNAFLDAALLANSASGAPATLPTGLTVETGKLAALADALNTCTSADGSTCTPLFTAATPPSGTAPIDTFTAALDIVQNPGQNVAAIFATVPTTPAPPFATTLTASPNDWTMSLTVTGGGLATPTALGIDSQNNIWVADEAGPLSAFNPQGTPLSSTGFGIFGGVPVIVDVFGLAIDPSNNIWVTNEQGYGGGGTGSITEFYGVNNPTTFPTGTSPQPDGYSNDIYFPVSIAADTSSNNGNIYVANTGTSDVTVYNSSGNVVSAFLGGNYGFSAGQNNIAIDAAHGFWLSNNEDDVEHFSSTGTLLVNAACCSESLGIATDATGDLWIADYLGGSDNRGAVAEAVTDTSGNTSVPISNLVTGGINHPVAVAVDAAQNVWFANYINGSITELAGANNTLPVGTAISPSTGVNGTGGYGLDARLSGPYALLPDRSGNLWVSNESLNTVTMFFGLAAPTVTPLQPVPSAP